MSTPIPPENSPICLDNVLVNFDPTTDGRIRYSTVTLTPSQTANKRIWTLKSVGFFRERTTADREYKVVYDFSNVSPAILEQFFVKFGQGINGTITVTNTKSTKGKVLDAATHVTFTQSEDRKTITLFVRGLCQARRFEWNVDLYDGAVPTVNCSEYDSCWQYSTSTPVTCSPSTTICYETGYAKYVKRVCTSNGTKIYKCDLP